MTFNDLCRLFGYKRTTMEKVIRQPGFPKPWNLTDSPRGRRWDEGQVREYREMMREAA